MITQAHGARPNVILLFADDQRADTIAAHGNPNIETPNLDALARDGFSFRRNYCAGSFSGAVCVASRAMLMTGRHWMRLPARRTATNWNGLPVLPALLSESANYRSFIVGKWHNGQSELLRAFSSGASVYMGGMANHASFKVQDLVDGQLTAKRDAGGFSSTVFANSAIEFIRDSPPNQPFFLYVAFTAPHDPRNPPSDYRQRYYSKRPPLPPNYLPLHPFNNAPQTTAGRDESLAPWPRTENVIRDQLSEYYGLISHLDEQVGGILAALDSSPHAGNTIVIYSADHGLAMGSHGLLGKQNVYEQSMRCPLIFRGPGIPEGQASEAFTYVHDLFSTICSFAGLEKPDDVDSQDLLPLMKKQTQRVRDYVYLPFQENQRAISDGRWKLHVYPKINHRLLFDLEHDPHELQNLFLVTSYQDKVEHMVSLLDHARREHGDRVPLGVRSPEPLKPVYDNEKRRLDQWQPDWIREKYFSD